MPENHYDVLLDGNDTEPIKMIEAKETSCVNKKHGLWCRFKKRFGLKKKTKPRRYDADQSAVNHDDKINLIASSSVESITRLEDDYAYRGRKVDFRIIPKAYRLMEEVVCDVTSSANDSGFHDDESSQDDDEEMITEGRQRRRLKNYLAKQWRGRRAKHARKSLRQSSKGMWVYLQTNLQAQFLFLDASSLISAAQANRGGGT